MTARFDLQSHLVEMIRHRRAAGVAQRRRRMPRQLQPDALRAEYLAALEPYALMMREIVRDTVLAELSHILASARATRGDSARMDTGQLAQEAIERAQRRFEQQWQARRRELDAMTERTADRTGRFQKAQLQRQLAAAFGIEVPIHDRTLGPRIRDFVTENAALIRSVNVDALSEVEAIVLRGVRDGSRHEDIAPEIEKRFGVSESRAALIARDQVGKFAAELNQARQTELGIKGYVWRTSNDERVRASHAEKEGRDYEWSDPPSDTGNPGEDVNCRCWAEPKVEDALTALGI